MGDRSYSFDANNVLSDGGAAYTASSQGQAGGVAASIDFGGNQGQVPKLQPRIDAMLVINLLSLVDVNANNVYRVTLQGSNDPGFGAGTCECLAERDFGNAAARDGNNGLTTSAPPGTGQYPADSIYEMPFTNEQNGTKYQYARLWVSVAGTNASLQFSAFVATLPEP